MKCYCKNTWLSSVCRFVVIAYQGVIACALSSAKKATQPFSTRVFLNGQLEISPLLGKVCVSDKQNGKPMLNGSMISPEIDLASRGAGDDR